MIFGIGTDIIEVARVEKLIARGRQYLDTIYTVAEVEYCEARARKSEHYAVRYAAKEATLKALGVGWRGGLSFSDIEVVNDELGKPRVVVHGKTKEIFDRNQISQSSISLSHGRESAIAVIILEK